MDKIERVNDARMAFVAYNKFEDTCKKIQADYVSRALNDYRSEKYTYEKALGFISSYAAIDDILLKLKKQIMAVNTYTQEENKNE